MGSEGMAKKRRRILSATTEVKRIARQRLGTAPPARVIPDKRKQQKEKHKPDYRDLAE
jgi:hypothetical protein